MSRATRSQRMATRSGTEWVTVRRILFGLHGYFRQTLQSWSPCCDEVKREWGLQFLNIRVGFSKTHVAWKDGKKPRIERGFW